MIPPGARVKHNHRPVNTGRRFSMNAVRPSLKSALLKQVSLMALIAAMSCWLSSFSISAMERAMPMTVLTSSSTCTHGLIRPMRYLHRHGVAFLGLVEGDRPDPTLPRGQHLAMREGGGSGGFQQGQITPLARSPAISASV